MERERKADAGLQRYEVWLRPSEWPMIHKQVERIAKTRHLYDERGNRKRTTVRNKGNAK